MRAVENLEEGVVFDAVAAAQLANALKAKQGLGSLRALARAVSVPHQSLAAAMQGTRPFGLYLLRAILRAYPDLKPHVEAYLGVHDQAA